MNSVSDQGSAQVFAGADTHTDTHHAAVVDPLGRAVADREFPTTTQGYRALLTWLMAFGHVQAVGVECTGSYGAGLTTVLSAADLVVVEVNVLDRGTATPAASPTRSTPMPPLAQHCSCHRGRLVVPRSTGVSLTKVTR